MRTLFLSLWKSYFLCLRRVTGPSPAWLTRWTPLSWWQRRRGTWSASPLEKKKKKTSAEHYASTCPASLLLMGINIYMVWRVSPWWRSAMACGEAKTWVDEVVCVIHVWLRACVSVHKCISRYTFKAFGSPITILYLSHSYKDINVGIQCNIETGPRGVWHTFTSQPVLQYSSKAVSLMSAEEAWKHSMLSVSFDTDSKFLVMAPLIFSVQLLSSIWHLSQHDAQR